MSDDSMRVQDFAHVTDAVWLATEPEIWKGNLPDATEETEFISVLRMRGRVQQSRSVYVERPGH
jgi:hypothetical protein